MRLLKKKQVYKKSNLGPKLDYLLEKYSDKL